MNLEWSFFAFLCLGEYFGGVEIKRLSENFLFYSFI